MLQNFSRVQKILDHIRIFGVSDEFDLNSELDLAIENSPNAFEILQILSEARPYFLEMDVALQGHILAEAIRKVKYYQENMDTVKEKQLDSFMKERKVTICVSGFIICLIAGNLFWYSVS